MKKRSDKLFKDHNTTSISNALFFKSRCMICGSTPYLISNKMGLFKYYKKYRCKQIKLSYFLEDDPKWYTNMSVFKSKYNIDKYKANTYKNIFNKTRYKTIAFCECGARQWILSSNNTIQSIYRKANKEINIKSNSIISV